MSRSLGSFSVSAFLVVICLAPLSYGCPDGKQPMEDAGLADSYHSADTRQTGDSAGDSRLDTSSDAADTADDVSMDTSDGSSGSLLTQIADSPGQGVDFYQLSDRWAVRVPSRRGPGYDQTFLILYDISDPHDIFVADSIAFDVPRVEGVPDGESFLIAGQSTDSSWIKRFAIDEGNLSEKESFTGGLDSDHPLDSFLVDMVTNGSDTYVILRDAFLEIGSGTLGLGIARRVDRSKEMDERDLSAGIMTDQYELTSEGQFLEKVRGGRGLPELVLWNTQRDSESGALIAGKFHSDRCCSGSSWNWTYSAATDMVYGWSNPENNTPTSYDLLTAIDISDPSAIAVVGRWSLKDGFSKSARLHNAIFARSGRVFFNGRPNLFVLRDSDDPQQIEELGIVKSEQLNFPSEQADTEFRNIAVTGDSLFVRYDPPETEVTFPEVPFIRVPLSDLPTNQ